MNVNRYRRPLLSGATLGSLLMLACGGGEPPIPAVTIDPATITTLQADAALQVVQDIAVDESGQFWVLQRDNSPHVFLYSAEGQLLDLFGTTGERKQMVPN